MSTYFPVYMYHQVAPADSTGFEPYLYVTPAAFEKQVKYLQGHGYRLTTLTEAWRLARQGNAGRIAVLTFDDLYQNFVDFAFPVLQRLEATATAFAIGGLQAAGSHVDNLPGDICAAGNESLRMLADAGIEIGAHTMTHRELPPLTDTDLRVEVADCKYRLEGILGREVTSFCYPRGRFSPRVMRAVEQAGYECACTTLRGNRHESAFGIKRIRVDDARQGWKLGYTAGWFYDWRNRKRCAREEALFTSQDHAVS